MKTIGMIVAVELQSVLKRYGAKLVKRKETAGYQVLEYETDQYRMVIVNCGPGEIAAASGTQFLISEYHVDIDEFWCSGWSYGRDVQNKSLYCGESCSL